MDLHLTSLITEIRFNAAFCIIRHVKQILTATSNRVVEVRSVDLESNYDEDNSSLWADAEIKQCTILH